MTDVIPRLPLTEKAMLLIIQLRRNPDVLPPFNVSFLYYFIMITFRMKYFVHVPPQSLKCIKKEGVFIKYKVQ